MYISCSWDDGTYADANVIEIMKDLQITGTFFLIGRFLQYRLKRSGKKTLRMYDGMEVGGHTMTHANLTEISKDQVSEEVGKCQQLLNELFERPITSFAFPGGYASWEIEESIRQFGINYVRTTTSWYPGMFQRWVRPDACFEHRKTFWQAYEKARGYFCFYGHAKGLSKELIYESLKRIKEDGHTFVTHEVMLKRLLA